MAVKKELTPEVKRVAVDGGTEPPFKNAYWDNKGEGIYVDALTGVPLFSSKDKFDSGTGWPSFYRPLHESDLLYIEDRSHGMVRTEVRSKEGKTHLGHVFDDVPRDRRYCMNSASLLFIPKEEMAGKGYGEYLYLFEPDR